MQWAESLIVNSAYGGYITYSSGWYEGLSDVELLARAIYCEGGTKYTSEEDAVARVILNRINNEDFPDTAREVLTERLQFSSVTGGSSATENSRVPDTSTTRWEHSTYLACLMLTTSVTTEWNAIVGNPLSGQLFFYAYTTAQSDYNSNNSVFSGTGDNLKYGSIDIENVYVLGYGNVTSFEGLFSSYTPTVYSRNIYYNYK